MREAPDAIILCGGAGSRLKQITGHAPKAMANIAGRPFLELLLRQLRSHGFERAILAVGYRQEMIRDCFGERACGLQLVYSPEAYPLGTGGALRNAADHIGSDIALVMNGDSYIDVDLSALVTCHRESLVDAYLVIAPSDGRDDCGVVRITKDGSVISFKEKPVHSSSQYLNAGIYALSRRLIYDIPAGVPISIETELLQRWLMEKKFIKGLICSHKCIDIGTPERYQAAQKSLALPNAQGKTISEDRAV